MTGNVEEAGAPLQAMSTTVAKDDRPAEKSALRKALPWLLRSVGLLVLLGLAFFGVDIVGGLELMVEAQPAYLAPAFVMLCLSLGTRLAVWTALARLFKLGYTRFRSYARIFFIGWAAGLGLPRGATPFARAAALASDKRSLGRAAIIEIGDRLLLLTALLVLAAVSGTYLWADSSRALLGVGIAAAAVVAAIPPLALIVWLARPLVRSIRSHRWVASFVDDVSAALKELRNVRPTILGGLLAAVIGSVLLNATALFFASRALDIPLSFPALVAAVSIVGLAGLLPISINNLGPREGILTAAVAGAGFSSEAGVALGLLWFVMQAATRLLAAASWFMRSVEPPPEETSVAHAEAEPGSAD